MRRPTLALTLLLAAACTPAPTTGTPAGLPSAGLAALDGTERFPITVGTGDTTQFRGQLRVARLEAKGFQTKAAGDGTDVALLLDAAEVLDPALNQLTVAPVPVKAADMEAFIENEWDAYDGGKDDPGRQSADFLKLARHAGLNVGEFLDLHQHLRMPLKDTVAFLDMCDAIGSQRGTSGAEVLDDLLETLRVFALSPGDFVRIVNEADQSVEGFLLGLDSRQGSLAHFLEAADKADGTLQDAIRRSAALTVQAVPETAYDEPFIYTPRVDTVVHNAITGSVGHVTYNVSRDPAAYAAGVALKAPKRWLIIGSPSNPLAKAEWILTYLGRAMNNKPLFRGMFMTGIGAEYPTIQSQLSWYLNAAVYVSAPYNRGLSHEPVAATRFLHEIAANVTFDTAYVWAEGYNVDARNTTIEPPPVTTDHRHVWTPFRNAVDVTIRRKQ